MLPGPEYLEDLPWPSEATGTVIRQQYLCHDDRPFVMDVTHQSLVTVGLSSEVVRGGASAAQSRNNIRVQSTYSIVMHNWPRYVRNASRIFHWRRSLLIMFLIMWNFQEKSMGVDICSSSSFVRHCHAISRAPIGRQTT